MPSGLNDQSEILKIHADIQLADWRIGIVNSSGQIETMVLQVLSPHDNLAQPGWSLKNHYSPGVLFCRTRVEFFYEGTQRNRFVYKYGPKGEN